MTVWVGCGSQGRLLIDPLEQILGGASVAGRKSVDGGLKEAGMAGMM